MNFQTPLCEMAYKYGSDKCPQLRHSYTPFYYQLLKNRKHSIRKVLELGIGYFTAMPHVVRLKGSYLRGASLYMWRDFFPNAQIFGADILPQAMFKDARITTYLCDQTNRTDLLKLVQNVGSDIDLIIDDGSHLKEDQISTCLTIMPLVNKGVTYIIEDVQYPEITSAALSKYECWIPNLNRRCRDDHLVVVKNRHE